MEARPVVPVVVGTPVTIVMVVDLLQAVPGVILPIWEVAKEEQIRIEALLNPLPSGVSYSKDDLAAAKVSCADGLPARFDDCTGRACTAGGC